MNNQVGEESPLSLPERHSRILALLQQHGSISVTQLAEMFKVSEVTIRKDLSYLESQKKLYRTHGSAILISPYISDRHVNEKEKRNVTEKRAMEPRLRSCSNGTIRSSSLRVLRWPSWLMKSNRSGG